MTYRIRLVPLVAVCLAVAFAGCDGGGQSAGPPTIPVPPPAPVPPPPPPEPKTWIGFADPARASLFEGGRVRAVVLVSGEVLGSPLRLSVESSAPADQLLVPEELDIGVSRHGAIEIIGLDDGRSEAPSRYQITLTPPPEGLPPGVVFAEAATTFRVTLNDRDREPGCTRLQLVATHERFDSDGKFSTAQITLEGSQNVALRFVEPYWDERLEERNEPPNVPIDLSNVPPINLAIPNSLSYQPLSAGGHRQRISLSWYRDLQLAAVAPGCKPVPVRCRRESRRTTRCSP